MITAHWEINGTCDKGNKQLKVTQEYKFGGTPAEFLFT